jgi:hypothetical protein
MGRWHCFNNSELVAPTNPKKKIRLIGSTNCLLAAVCIGIDENNANGGFLGKQSK